jgi:diacylglycerol O-acyltransferase / trehalose O-mycolyltransferase
VRRVVYLVANLSVTAVLLVLGAPSASAAGPAARLVSETPGTGRLVDISVYSPSMQRDITLEVLRPAHTDTRAPTLYLLNGAGGGEDDAKWLDRTDITRYFADKNVNVVIPTKGELSYYTDWERPDPKLAKKLHNNGRNMWETFLVHELPPVIDSAFHTNGINALAGISMAATSALNLSIAAPRLYRSVAAYSGCAMTSDPLGHSAVTVVLSVDGADPRNMWGPAGGPDWRAHDPYLNAARLPNIPMYISSGSGLPGQHDTLADPTVNHSRGMLANQMIVGGVIEAASNYCTAELAERTRALGRTNITYYFQPTGTHSWGYWQDELHRSWPMLAASLGI